MQKIAYPLPFYIETIEKHAFYVEKHLKKEQPIILSVTFTPYK